MTRTALVVLALLIAAPPPVLAHGKDGNHANPNTPASASYGAVHFANSGNAAAQASFGRGLAQLHNFEYGTAAEFFRTAQAADPGFAMAYWGEAMTYNHPVWFEQDATAARAVLAKLGPTPAARAAKAKTQREADYLAALEILYGDGSKDDRDLRYRDAMLKLHQRYPTDVDATAFAALSELGTAHQGRDYATYMRSAALLEDVFPTNLTHPGVLHYLIHSYDDPIHAPLGLRPALRYGAVAPDAGHALHMTSHIFLALGLWPQTISANIAADAASNRTRAAAGKPPFHCGHYADWLTYAYLQTGEIAKHDAAMAACGTSATTALARPNPPVLENYRDPVRSWSDMQARRAVETRDWRPVSLPEGRYLASRYRQLYAEAVATRGDAARLAAIAAQMTALSATMAAEHAKLPADADDSSADYPAKFKIMAGQVKALEQLAAGQTAAGIAALRAVAAEEAAQPVDFGPPEVFKPSYELLGEVLLAQGQYAEAQVAFGKALEAAPGRRLALAGLAAAQKK